MSIIKINNDVERSSTLNDARLNRRLSKSRVIDEIAKYVSLLIKNCAIYKLENSLV